MSPVEAAFRLYCTTPREMIRTHHSRIAPEREQGRRIGDKIPEDLIAEVHALNLRGLGQTEIIKRLTMGKHLYDRIRRTLAHRTTKEQRRAQIKEMLERGITERRIAVIVGISRTDVQNYKRAAALLT